VLDKPKFNKNPHIITDSVAVFCCSELCKNGLNEMIQVFGQVSLTQNSQGISLTLTPEGNTEQLFVTIISSQTVRTVATDEVSNHQPMIHISAYQIVQTNLISIHFVPKRLLQNSVNSIYITIWKLVNFVEKNIMRSMMISISLPLKKM
jgi:hypothetical protein